MVIHATISFIIFLVGPVCSQCNFPADLIGVWKHSFHGDLNFVNSSQFLMTIGTYKDVPGKCHAKINDDTYFVVSDKVRVDLGENRFLSIYIGICLQMDRIKTNLYKLTHLTSELLLAEYARVKLVFNPESAQAVDVCNDNTTDARKEYYLLMKKGSEDTISEECPPWIQGRTEFNFNSTSCSTKIDTCADNTGLATNNTCSAAVAYSENGRVSCIHQDGHNGSKILWTYNKDNATNERSTFYFTCYMFDVNGNSIEGTQNPRFCDATQNATTVSTGNTKAEVWGANLRGRKDYCVPPTTPVSMTTEKEISGGITLTSHLSLITLILVAVLSL